MTGPEKSLQAVTMVQGGQSVARPSTLTSERFSLAYTGAQLPGGA